MNTTYSPCHRVFVLHRDKKFWVFFYGKLYRVFRDRRSAYYEVLHLISTGLSDGDIQHANTFIKNALCNEERHGRVQGDLLRFCLLH